METVLSNVVKEKKLLQGSTLRNTIRKEADQVQLNTFKLTGSKE